MQHLFEKLRDDTFNWRKEGYPCPDYPLIGEVLRYQFEGEPGEQISLKYLREPQFQSLELYWYLRLVLQTPHIVDLYKHYYSDDKRDFFEAFGIPVDPTELQWIPNGEFYIIEIKSERDRMNPTVEAKRKAVERLEQLQFNAHFKYHIIYTDTAFMRENIGDIDTVLQKLNIHLICCSFNIS